MSPSNSSFLRGAATITLEVKIKDGFVCAIPMSVARIKESGRMVIGEEREVRGARSRAKERANEKKIMQGGKCFRTRLEILPSNVEIPL